MCAIIRVADAESAAFVLFCGNAQATDMIIIIFIVGHGYVIEQEEC